MFTGINEDALNYWRITGYQDSDLDQFCRAFDERFMIAKITFIPNASAKISISQKTWTRQEGHYGTIVKTFEKICATPLGRTLSGSIVVWLEDGAFDYTRDRTGTVPLLAFGRSVDDTRTILMPDPSFLGANGYKQDMDNLAAIDTVPFEKKGRAIFWRGAASGTGMDYPSLWESCARGILALKAKKLNRPEVLDAKITKIDHLSPEQQKNLTEHGVVGDYVPFEKFLQHAYLIDADGFHCAWRSYYLKLATKSVTVKMASNWEQWYFRDLRPWVHYAPLMADLTDVVELHRWLEAHPNECRAIIENANAFARSLTYESEMEKLAKLCHAILLLRRN